VEPVHTPGALTMASALDVRIEDASRLEGLIRLADALRSEGLVVVVKWDGERQPDAGDNGPYTVVVSRPSDGSFIRRDDDSLEGAFEYVYALLAQGEAPSPLEG